ncbi:MAG TPA: UPF0182 family protein [Candidatus Dormibacteraeota bacterium]|nr:UPF0182 family protein [Candidatus Dormibacteraeota bacterium]
MTRRYRPFDPFERGGFEPPREIRIPRPPRRFWVGLSLVGLAILIFIFTSPIVGVITELQWYDALGFKDVYTTRLVLQTALFVGSLLVAFVYLAANVLIALRIRSGPGLRAVGIRRSIVRSAAGAVALSAAGIVALILSTGAGTQWQALALFQHATPTGTVDPVLGQDISFYLLSLPFLHSVVNWALGLAFMGALLTVALYAWRGDTFALNFTPPAIAHISGMLAVFALTLAAWTWLGRFDLLFAHNGGVVWGAAYSDINARLPILTFEAGGGIVVAGALIANMWVRRLWLPVASAVVWVAMLILGGIYPAVVQSFLVTPNAQSYELPFIQREIAGTRQGYGLSDVTVQNFTGDQPLTAQAVQNDSVTIDNLRLWDAPELQDTYEQQQGIRTYYHFSNIDIDRYTIGGQYKSLEISAREFDYTRLPDSAQNWINQHLQYTHGYGVAASPVNAVAGEGLPDYVVGDVPPTGSLPVTQPAIYFGQLNNPNDYAIAPTSTREFDYPQGAQDVYTNYTGTHGVPLNGVNRALWSLKLGDFNLLVSGQLTPKSQILYRRNIIDRVSEIAPFLDFDGDPYIVVVDGKLYWIIDAYTTADSFPYSQETQFQGGDINYIRNSVKVVIDAYDGTATFYVVDPNDPLIRAYEGTFPTLFQPLDSMPEGLRAHIRVPEDLFNTQVNIYATYHISDPHVFFAREDVWDIPTASSSPGATGTQVQPYYVLFRLPGESKPEFLLIMPFTPHGKPNMVSWLAARSDGSNYGKYVAFVLPKDKVIFGPQQVANRINENPAVSRDFTLFHQAGSQVQQGNLLVVPIGDSFLYFEPIYLRASQTESLPELKKVILADQDTVVYTDTLQEAIDQLVGASTGQPPPTTTPPSTITPAVLAQITGLVAQANLHYQAAYAALKIGDFTTFASEMQQVGQILQELQTLTGGTPGTSPSPSPSPGARASPSPGASASP